MRDDLGMFLGRSSVFEVELNLGPNEWSYAGGSDTEAGARAIAGDVFAMQAGYRAVRVVEVVKITRERYYLKPSKGERI
jgi:hypothetical protein